MYARFVSFVVKPNQIRKFCDEVSEIAHEVARKRPGFVEHMIFVSEQEKRLVTVVSLWSTKTEADQYHEEIFPVALKKLTPLIDSGPILQYFTTIVSNSSHLASKGVAA